MLLYFVHDDGFPYFQDEELNHLPQEYHKVNPNVEKQEPDKDEAWIIVNYRVYIQIGVENHEVRKAKSARLIENLYIQVLIDGLSND